MSVVNIGLAPNDGLGDPARTAFGNINTQFDTLASATKLSATAEELAAAVTIAQATYPPYDVRRYGVVLDGTTNNAAALNAIGAGAWTSDVTLYWPPGACRINDTVTFGNIHLAHYFDNRSTIEYYGATDRAAFIQGNASTSQGSKNALGGAGISITNHTSNLYTDEAFVGLKILGTMQHCRNLIRGMSNFTIGMQLRPSTSGIAYNIFELFAFLDNKFCIDIHSFTNGATEFVNENIFNGGSFRTSGLSSAIDSYGVRFAAETGAYTGHNRNIFNKPSFELGNASGATNRTPVLYSNAGSKNEFRQARVETGRGYVVDIVSTTATVNTNIFEGAVLAGTWTGYQRESDGGLAYGNSFTDIVDGREFQKPRHFSGDLLKKAFGSDTAKISIKGHFFQATASSTATYAGTGKIFKDYVVVTSTSNAFGVEIDTSYYKSFLVRADLRSGFGGRRRIVCYDSAGAILDSGGGGHPYAVSNSALAYATTFGNSYGTQSDATGSGFYFSVGSAVAKIRLLFTGGSAALHIRSYELYALTNADNPKTLRISTPLSQGEDDWYCNGDPATVLGGGFVAEGQRVASSAASSSTTSGYVATAEGYNASAWVAATAYLIGQLVNNDTGKVYECLTAGTSAGSGGPTGTAASGITDNTAVWGYIGTLATWQSIPFAANPSASLGLAAVNGTAATFMRSDGAPALDVTMAPTWTGIHNYSAAEPRIKITQTGATTDEKLWDWDLASKVLTLRTRTDADGAGVTALTFTRGTGTAMTSGGWTPAGVFSFGGPISVGVVSSSVSGVGIHRPGTNRLGFHTTSLLRGEFDASGNFIATKAIADQSKSVQVPTTGFSITIADNTSTLTLNPAGTLATGTVTMPATPIDGQLIRVMSSQIITALTVSPNSGQTVNGAPTTLAANTGFGYIYHLAGTTWYRMY